MYAISNVSFLKGYQGKRRQEVEKKEDEKKENEKKKDGYKFSKRTLKSQERFSVHFECENNQEDLICD